MNTDIIEGKWDQLAGQLQKRWARLTDGDLDEIEGERRRLEGILRERYGYSRRHARAEVEDFMNRIESGAAETRERVQDRVQRAQDMLQERLSNLRRNAESAADELDDEMFEEDEMEMELELEDEGYPWLAIIGAMIAGILLGIMLSPSKR